MTLSDEAIQLQIQAEVRDDNTVATQWDFIWEWAGEQALDSVAETSRYYTRLRYQHALVKACDTLLGSVREHVDFEEKDRAQDLDQLTKHLLSKREGALSEVAALVKRARAGSGTLSPRVGVMTTRAPLTGQVGGPDPNSSYYAGDHTKAAPDLVTE